MPEPVTIAAVAIGGLSWLCHSTLGAAAIGGAIGNPADRVIAATLRSVNSRIAGLRGLPENHDVARAVRMAQIQALERVIREYREIGRPEWKIEPYTRPEIFFQRSLDFCTDTIGRCLPNARVRLNLEITAPLTQAIDGTLSEPEGNRPAATRAAQIARLAEDAVLDELCQELKGVALPEGFETHFRIGNAERRRFLDLFGGFVANQIKHDAKFRAS
jgi:hypothetical protein